MTWGAAGPQGGVADVIASARAGEPDRYLAALLSPASARPALLALAAFAAEIGRVGRLVTREPAMGEIRLQWWRDALLTECQALTGHPVADALRSAIGEGVLPRDRVLSLIDAHEADLAADPFPDEAALSAYLAGTEAALFTLAAVVLGAQGGPALASAAGQAGHAYGLARLLAGLPGALARNRLPIPQTRLAKAGLTRESLVASADPRGLAALEADMVSEARGALVAARRHVADLPASLRPAFLPLALVGPYLRALERRGHAPLREAAEILPLTRVVRIAAAHWLGRL